MGLFETHLWLLAIFIVALDILVDGAKAVLRRILRGDYRSLVQRFWRRGLA